MQSMHIGDFEVHRVAEFEGPFFPPSEFFPDFDPEVVRANADLLGPQADRAGQRQADVQLSYLHRQTGRHTILIDSCLGQRQGAPDAAAISPDAYSLPRRPRSCRGQAGGMSTNVMCTHLHWDHVGWNTRREKRALVPTFPNARYVMAPREFTHWQEVAPERRRTRRIAAPSRTAWLPVVRTGQSVLVDERLRLRGRTVVRRRFPVTRRGMSVIHARSGDETGVFNGRRNPPPAAAAEARMVDARLHRSRIVAHDAHPGLIEEHAERGTRLLPAHFPAPTVGRIVRRGGGVLVRVRVVPHLSSRAVGLIGFRRARTPSATAFLGARDISLFLFWLGAPTSIRSRIQRIVRRPERRRVQLDGRIRRWGLRASLGGYLRVVLLSDGETVHNGLLR